MPNTYTLISSNVLSSSAASVTFSAIPATFTDLVLRYSVRMSPSQAQDTFTIGTNISGSVYSAIRLRGNGAAASSAVAQSGATSMVSGLTNCATSTANTFTNAEMYIPSYLSSANKPISQITSMENNTTTAYIDAHAHLIGSSTAINSITFTASGDFVSGSSFYLYGIKNS
jgi:hypothetical protein